MLYNFVLLLLCELATLEIFIPNIVASQPLLIIFALVSSGWITWLGKD